MDAVLMFAGIFLVGIAVIAVDLVVRTLDDDRDRYASQRKGRSR